MKKLLKKVFRKFNILLLQYYLKIPQEYIVCFGTITQEGTMFAKVESLKLWKRETRKRKAISILRKRWVPNQTDLQAIAKEYFINEVFGSEEDFGENLFDLIHWHNSQEWDLSSLTPDDLNKAKSLNSMTILTDMKFNEVPYKLMPLNLAAIVPDICILSYPMIVKIPIISFRLYLKIHYHFAFNSIRRSMHPQSDDLIAYIYEIFFIQQKITNELHEFIKLGYYTEAKKKDALLIRAEIDSIICADNIFSYLKATIEKIIVLIGLTHNIKNLETKKTHKAKLESLLKNLPTTVTCLSYWHRIEDLISSESIEVLNNYRTGLLHKKGIAELQPHNYIKKEVEALPFRKIYSVIQEQHKKNTAVLIAALAILTDDLVVRDKPKISMEKLINSLFKQDIENN